MQFRRLKDLREDHDYTQQFIADYLCTHRTAYQRYENGTREIPTWAVIQLSKLYEVTTDYLLGLSDEPR